VYELLHKEAEGQLGFNGRVSDARKLIRELGFRWRTQDTSKMLMESHDVSSLRVN
jgi:hypothetical protein